MCTRKLCDASIKRAVGSLSPKRLYSTMSPMTTLRRSWPRWSIIALLLAGCTHHDAAVHHYTVTANGSKHYVFVFEKQLLVPHKAALLDAGGQFIQPFTDSLEALPVAVQAATFYKDSVLLVTLEDGSLFQYTLHGGAIRHVPAADTGTAIRGDALLLSPNTAVRLSAESFDGLNFTGNDLIATDLQTGASCTLAKDVARFYQQGDSLFYTKDFHQLYGLDANGGSRKLLSLTDSVTQLTGNGVYSALLSWEGLSASIDQMYRLRKNASYTTRIGAAGSATNIFGAGKYALKVLDTKTGKTLLCDSFPTDKQFDVQRFRFIDAGHLLVEQNRRDSPLVKVAFIVSLPDLQEHALPENSVVLNANADYLVLLRNELLVYDLHTYQYHAVGNIADSAAVLVNNSCCGTYYFSIAAPGGSASLQALDVQEGSVREVKRLRW